MKRIALIILLIALIMTPSLALALEIDFPEVGGLEPPAPGQKNDSYGPADWINYLFVFALGIVGLVIIGSVVYAGAQYMTAGGSESKVSEAKDRIKSALIGLLILVGSYIFLYTINPNLVKIKNPKIKFDIESKWTDYFLPNPSSKLIGEECKNNGECLSGKCDTASKKCVTNPKAITPK